MAEQSDEDQVERRSVRRGGRLRAWAGHRHDPLTSLLLTIPVFLIYHLGILLVDMRNGVDLVSGLTFELLQRSLLGYVGVTIGYAVAIAIAAWGLRKKGRIKTAELFPVLLESLVLAVIMTFTVGWATHQLLFDWQVGPPGMGPVEKLVMAAGAGFHEELIFRFLIFGGGTWLITKLVRARRDVRAAVLMALVSSLVFSAIHYVGPFGDPFRVDSFVFRGLAGLYLVAVYRWRGFAVAVYTHTFYDLIVFFL